MQTQGQWSAVQGAAVMILLRLFPFFCCGTAFSAAEAKQMMLTAALHTALILPLLHFRHRLHIPAMLLRGFRLCAAFEGAYLTLRLRQLCLQLRLQHTKALLLMLLVMLLYTVSLHDRAAARTAMLLLCLAAFGFLLLPVSGIGTAQRILLHTADSAPHFAQDWADACELPLIPLILQKQTESAAKHSAHAWAAFRILFLPAVVLFGTMQNGRLRRFQGNPFFLLLARTPLSDAVRTDGFWMLLAFGCGALCITFCLQTAKPHLHTQRRMLAAAFLPYLFFLALLLLFPQAAAVTGLLHLLFGILIPWGIILHSLLFDRRESA